MKRRFARPIRLAVPRECFHFSSEKFYPRFYDAMGLLFFICVALIFCRAGISYDVVDGSSSCRPCSPLLDFERPTLIKLALEIEY